jgi:hypothetical protein
MGNTSQSGMTSTSNSEKTEVDSQQNTEIYEQILHLLSNVIDKNNPYLIFDNEYILVMY